MTTRVITQSRTLAVLAVACAMAAFTAQPAAAQVARNLNCSKCVDTKDIDKKAVSRSKIKKGAINRSRLNADLQEHVDGRQPFYAVLDGDGSTEIIAQTETFTIFARCVLNFFDADAAEFRDAVQILVRSSLNGWFGDDGEFPPGADSSSGPFNAGDDVLFLQETVLTGEPDYDDDIDEFTAAAPDGSFIAIDGESTGLGLNIFGHDCIAIGNVYFVQGIL